MPREHGEEDGEVDVLGAEPEDAGVLHGPHHPRLPDGEKLNSSPDLASFSTAKSLRS